MEYNLSWKKYVAYCEEYGDPSIRGWIRDAWETFLTNANCYVFGHAYDSIRGECLECFEKRPPPAGFIRAWWHWFYWTHINKEYRPSQAELDKKLSEMRHNSGDQHLEK